MELIKKYFWPVIVVFLVISVSLNIKNQLMTLIDARKKNEELNQKIERVKKDKQELIKKIEYATDSAFIEQERHDKLALGKENDVWLGLSIEKEIDLRVEMNENKEISNYQRWLNLFTR